MLERTAACEVAALALAPPLHVIAEGPFGIL